MVTKINTNFIFFKIVSEFSLGFLRFASNFSWFFFSIFTIFFSNFCSTFSHIFFSKYSRIFFSKFIDLYCEKVDEFKNGMFQSNSYNTNILSRFYLIVTKFISITVFRFFLLHPNFFSKWFKFCFQKLKEIHFSTAQPLSKICAPFLYP